jgi:hypothetical protein
MGELGIDDEIQAGHFVIVVDDDRGVIRKPFIAPASSVIQAHDQFRQAIGRDL